MSIEISKTQEGLYIFNFLWFRPILNDLDFSGTHLESLRSDDMTEVFNGFRMETTFLTISIKTMFSELSEDFGNMSIMVVLVSRKD